VPDGHSAFVQRLKGVNFGATQFDKPTRYMKEQLRQLAAQLEGDLFTDKTMRTLYATDASAYREMPLAVAIPKSKADIQQLIAFARNNKTSLIPRTAGTSLAG